MNEQNPGSGRGSGKRGRPAVGKPEQVRLSETEKALAISLGDGVLAKGVRVALQIAEKAQAKTDIQTAFESLAAALSPNTPPEGITSVELLQRVAHLLNAEAALKLRQKKALPTLAPQDLAIAAELGDGNPARGIEIALSAARFLGTETARKLNHHGSAHSI